MTDTDLKSRRGRNIVRDIAADKGNAKRTKANDRESFQPGAGPATTISLHDCKATVVSLKLLSFPFCPLSYCLL